MRPSLQNIRKISLRTQRVRSAPPGTSPGTINIPEDALQPKISLLIYNNDAYSEREIRNVEELLSLYEQHTDAVCWINIKGLGEQPLLEQLAEYFQIHPLEMEDVVNLYQRPKKEEFDSHVFMISRMLYSNSEDNLINEQVSLFLGKNYVITIHEKYADLLEPVRERIRKHKGNVRQSGADYLAYSIMDTLTDHYFPVLEKIGDRLEELEEELITNPSRKALNKIQQLKRDLIVFRRCVWPERDKLNDILRSDLHFISPGCKIFFRDSYDHCIQLLDIVESYKEVTASLMDIYLSSVSNRMNQIVKVLTVISAIFIPLTFIVGVYGMNFSRESPETGHTMPLNMPELYSPYGYAGVMGFMLLIALIQLLIFYRKGWLQKES